MSHLLFELEDYLDERALVAPSGSRCLILRYLSIFVGRIGSVIDAAVVAMKYVIWRR